MRTSPPIASNDERDQGTREQTIPVDLMIKRLEEANARAHEKAAPTEKPKPIQVPDAEVARLSSEQTRPAIPDPRSSRGGLAFGAAGLLLAACFGVVVWQSHYGEAAKQVVARWALPLVHTTTQGLTPGAAPMSAEAMARSLASISQEIERLKTGQEQMVRDHAAAVEQLSAALSQVTHDNATIAEQLKASQEQKLRRRGRR